MSVQRYDLPSGTGVNVQLVPAMYGKVVYVDDIKQHLPDGFFEEAPAVKTDLTDAADAKADSTDAAGAEADSTDAAKAAASEESSDVPEKVAEPDEKAVADNDDAKPAQDIDKKADAADSTENPDS